MQTRELKANEQKVLEVLMKNQDHSFREIAKIVGLNEVSVRRLHSRLRQKNIFSTLHIPNFAAIGYKIMMVQRIAVASSFLIETRNIMRNFVSEWGNCIDCHETYDGKIIARSVWRDADHFKKAHAAFYKKFGTEWLGRESIDMIPLEDHSSFFRVDCIQMT